VSHEPRACSKQLAHDLLNHLNVIVGNCELLIDRITTGCEDFTNKKQPDQSCELYLKRISEAAQLMTAKVKNAQSKEGSQL